MKRKTVKDYKDELVGKIINWLTILDVTPNPDGGHMICVCKCKCGTICTKELKKVITNHTMSCGCYNRSREKGQKHSQYFKDHPDTISRMISNLKLWRSNNKDKISEINAKISKWYSDHPEFTSSSQEKLLCDYISSIYNGKCLRNSRSIIPPQELDIYYPEKKIAVEFNGNFWHNTDHRHLDYHVNKYLRCKDIGILLVSIFEVDWLLRNNEVKLYLKDLFNNKTNDLSFSNNGCMNNNYPAPGVMTDSEIIRDFYKYKDSTVYTCGYSKIIV